MYVRTGRTTTPCSASEKRLLCVCVLLHVLPVVGYCTHASHAHPTVNDRTDKRLWRLFRWSAGGEGIFFPTSFLSVQSNQVPRKKKNRRLLLLLWAPSWSAFCRHITGNFDNTVRLCRKTQTAIWLYEVFGYTVVVIFLLQYFCIITREDGTGGRDLG